MKMSVISLSLALLVASLLSRTQTTKWVRLPEAHNHIPNGEVCLAVVHPRPFLTRVLGHSLVVWSVNNETFTSGYGSRPTKTEQDRVVSNRHGVLHNVPVRLVRCRPIDDKFDQMTKALHFDGQYNMVSRNCASVAHDAWQQWSGESLHFGYWSLGRLVPLLQR